MGARLSHVRRRLFLVVHCCSRRREAADQRIASQRAFPDPDSLVMILRQGGARVALSLAVTTLFLAHAARASTGDRLPEFRDCVDVSSLQSPWRATWETC